MIKPVDILLSYDLYSIKPTAFHQGYIDDQ